MRSTLANGTLHFDNSGSETDRLELDPTGNSIGFDAYEYGNFGYSPPPEDLFGGFPRFTGPAGETYSLNGIRIPREYAVDLATSSDLYGGVFGLLERSARRSAMVTVATRNGDWRRNYENQSAIPANNRVGIAQGELVAYYTHNNWAINWSLFGSLRQTQTNSVSSQDIVSQKANAKRKPAKVAKSTLQKAVNAVANCINTLWGGIVKLNSLDSSKNGHHGSANITYLDGDSLSHTNNVKNNVEFTAQQLGDLRASYIAGKFVTGANPVGGIGPQNGPRIISGNTYYFTPLENFTASNRDQYDSYFPALESLIGEHLDAQIHELGNSIHFLTGVNIGNPNAKDPDSGYQLEKCVANALTGGK